MYISPLLWVGRGPTEPYRPHPGIQGVRHANSVPQAVSLIQQHYAVVVATTEIAYQVLRGLGEDHQWASYATSGVVPGYDEEMFTMRDAGDD